jgi:hypothetical protein
VITTTRITLLPHPEEHSPEHLPEAPYHHNHASWRNPWVILAAVALVAFIGVNAVSFHQASSVAIGPDGPRTTIIRRGAYGEARVKLDQGAQDSSTQVNGVITAISGNTLTVAGNGTTRSVTVSSSTQYSGATSAAVNDTVIANGSVTGTTFDATTILVNP